MDLETLNGLNLVTKDCDELGLRLIKYNKTSTNMNDEFSKKCRGMVVEKDTNKIICMPPIKSMDLNEFITKFDNKQCLVEEFLDGTMINLWYYRDSWHISTRSSIGANCRWYSKKHFSELFEESNQIDFEKLNKNYYYSFVLQHPENRIVTIYSAPTITLVFVGEVLEDNTVRSVDYRKEQIGETLGVSIPREYDFGSIPELISFVEKADFQFQGVVIKNGIYRTKIRNPAYNYARNLRGNTRNMKYLYFDLIRSNFYKQSLQYFPEHKEMFSEFNKEFIELTRNLHKAYMGYHVKKTIKDIQDIEYALRPLCYGLHGVYKNTHQPITFDVTMKYLNTLPPALIVFSINHKYYKKNNVDLPEEMPVPVPMPAQ
jgi:hypothetical protein